MRPRLNGLIALLTVVFLIAGCTSSDEGVDEGATTTSTEVPAETVAAPETATTATSTTTTTAVEASPVVLNVMFTGEECVVEGPSAFPAGLVKIVFVNDSEELAGTSLARFTGEETFQDFVDYTGPEGPAKIPPTWIDFFGVTLPIGSGKTRTWQDSLEPGNYYLVCEVPGATQSYGMWYGAGLTVEG